MDLHRIAIQPITLDDLGLVADVHLAAFPNAALSKLGRETVRRYYLWCLSLPHDSVGIGVFIDGRIVGYCIAGVFRGSDAIFLRRNKGYIIWYLVTHPWLFVDNSVKKRIINIFQMVRQCFFRVVNNKEISTTVGKDMFGILAIAVEPLYQRSGIGNLLLGDIEKLALERGFSSMRLSVHLDNEKAISFYEKHDWKKILGLDGKWQGYMTKEIQR